MILLGANHRFVKLSQSESSSQKYPDDVEWENTDNIYVDGVTAQFDPNE